MNALVPVRIVKEFQKYKVNDVIVPTGSQRTVLLRGGYGVIDKTAKPTVSKIFASDHKPQKEKFTAMRFTQAWKRYPVGQVILVTEKERGILLEQGVAVVEIDAERASGAERGKIA